MAWHNGSSASWTQIDFPELQTLSTQSHCPSVICYTSAPLILLHLIEQFKKAGQSTFVIRLWVFCARYWQRSMKECRQFCHFFKHQTALFHIWRMPLFSSFLKALDKTNTLRPFDRWEIESERRASLEPTFPISGWSQFAPIVPNHGLHKPYSAKIMRANDGKPAAKLPSLKIPTCSNCVQHSEELWKCFGRKNGAGLRSKSRMCRKDLERIRRKVSALMLTSLSILHIFVIASAARLQGWDAMICKPCQ